MPLKTEVTSLTFAEIQLGATASLTRTLTLTVIEVLALITRDASPFHLESHGDEVGRDTNDTPPVGAEAFVSAVLGTQLPSPGMKIIGQDLRFDRTIVVGDKLTATFTGKEERKKDGVVIFDCRNREPVGETYDTGERSQ